MGRWGGWEEKPPPDPHALMLSYFLTYHSIA